jgi:hypothetical protein
VCIFLRVLCDIVLCVHVRVHYCCSSYTHSSSSSVSRDHSVRLLDHIRRFPFPFHRAHARAGDYISVYDQSPDNSHPILHITKQNQADNINREIVSETGKKSNSQKDGGCVPKVSLCGECFLFSRQHHQPSVIVKISASLPACLPACLLACLPACLLALLPACLPACLAAMHTDTCALFIRCLPCVCVCVCVCVCTCAIGYMYVQFRSDSLGPTCQATTSSLDALDTKMKCEGPWRGTGFRCAFGFVPVGLSVGWCAA